MSGIVASTLIRREWHPLLAKAARALNRINSVVPPPPSAVPATPQRVVIIHVHPNGREPSFTLALGEAVCESLEAAGGSIVPDSAPKKPKRLKAIFRNNSH